MASVPSMSISPMEEVDRKREPKASYKIPKKPRTSLSGSSSRDSGDRDRSSNRDRDRTRDHGREKDRHRRDSATFGDSRTSSSRRDSRDSKEGGYSSRRSGHLEAELDRAADDWPAGKDIGDAPAPGEWAPVPHRGDSGLPGINVLFIYFEK